MKHTQINLQNAYYGDIDSWYSEKESVYDTFFTGVTQGSPYTFFVLRIRDHFDTHTFEEKVVLASQIQGMPVTKYPKGAVDARGIAINSKGIALTTLPVNTSGSFDRLITFSTDFPETGNGTPTVAFNNVGLYSPGMTTDASDNFYVALGDVNTPLCSNMSSPWLAVVSPDVSSISCPSIIGSDGNTGGYNTGCCYAKDVAANPIDHNVYMTLYPTYSTDLGGFTASGGYVVRFPSPVTAATSSAPAVSLTSSALTFGHQIVGTTSPPQVLTLTNTGTGPLTVGNVAFTGNNPHDFTITADTCSGHSVDASASCTINTAFSPAAAGSRSAQLSITNNAPDSPQIVTLSGNGVDTAQQTVVSAQQTATQQTAVSAQQTATQQTAVAAQQTALAAQTVAAQQTAMTTIASPAPTNTTAPPPPPAPANTTVSPPPAPTNTTAPPPPPPAPINTTAPLPPVAPTGVAAPLTTAVTQAAPPSPTNAPQRRGQPAPTEIPQPVQPVVVNAPSTASHPSHPATLPLTLRLASSSLFSGDALTLRMDTAPRAWISATLQVTTTKVVVKGTGKKRTRVVRTVVLYRVGWQGVADGRGRVNGRVRVTYKPAKAVRATLIVIARTTRGTTTRTTTLTIQPPRRRHR